MTRKHYNAIADAINSQFINGETYNKIEIASIIAYALNGTNPNYDRSHFYNACMNGRKPKRKRKAK